MTQDNDYLWDRSGPEDPEVKKLEDLLGRFRVTEVASPLPERRRQVSLQWLVLPLAAAATLLVAVIGGSNAPFGPTASWRVVRATGAPLVDSNRLTGFGTANEGEWIETDDSSEAVIIVGSIGRVQVEPNSRVRLIRTRQDEHRLGLQRGTLHASIFAPPRVFFVETPSATAIDLGCAYTLTVDDRGNGRLCVTSGWVALEDDGHESIVPAGAVCETRPVLGPGTPYFGGASDEFRAALARFDFEGGQSVDLDAILRESNMCELFTLWQLLHRVKSDVRRGAIYDRMAEILPPPAGVTRDGILAMDIGMLEVWGAQFSRDEFTPCLASCTADVSDAQGPSAGGV